MAITKIDNTVLLTWIKGGEYYLFVYEINTEWENECLILDAMEEMVENQDLNFSEAELEVLCLQMNSLLLDTDEIDCYLESIIGNNNSNKSK